MYVDILKIHSRKPAILLSKAFEIPWPRDVFLRTNLSEDLKKLIILARCSF